MVSFQSSLAFIGGGDITMRRVSVLWPMDCSRSGRVPLPMSHMSSKAFSFPSLADLFEHMRAACVSQLVLHFISMMCVKFMIKFMTLLAVDYIMLFYQLTY